MITQHQPYNYTLKSLSMIQVVQGGISFFTYNQILKDIKTPIQEQVRQVLDCVDDILMPKIGS